MNDAVDGELDAMARWRLRLHLLLCPPCKRAYDSLARTLGLLRGLDEKPPPDR